MKLSSRTLDLIDETTGRADSLTAFEFVRKIDCIENHLLADLGQDAYSVMNSSVAGVFRECREESISVVLARSQAYLGEINDFIEYIC